MGDVLGGTQINPQTPPSYFQTVYGQNAQGQPTGYPGQQQFLNAIQTAAFDQSGLRGVPGYGGPLSPNVGSTMLPQVWGGWQGAAPGTDQTLAGTAFGQAAAAGAYGAQNPYGGAFGPQFGSIMNYGGVGGAPTQAMQNLQNTGVAGGGGVPLALLAQGGSALTNPLSQTFMGAAPTQAGLNQMLATGGGPINQLPAWQAMVGAQQRNIQEGAANLAEQFGTSDNRFSSSYGTAMTDYLTQTQLGQNALLGQMTATAGENAQQRLLSAAGTLGQMGYGAGGQMAGIGAGAASQLGGLSAGAAQNLFGNQNAQLGNFMTYGLGQGQLAQGFNQQGLAGAGQMANIYGQNLQLGQGLGMGQYGIGQSQINNAYQEFLRTQPQNNPFIGSMQQLATYYPSQYIPGYTPGALGQFMLGMGTLAGGLGMMGLSDERLKENIKKVGEAGGVNMFTFNYKGDPTPRFGPIAQDVEKTYPEAVIKGDDTTPWMIRTDALASMMRKAA